MDHNLVPSHAHMHAQRRSLATTVLHWLRRSPATRSVVYLGGAASILQGAIYLHPAPTPQAVLASHLTVLPLGAALTYAMHKLEGRPIAWTVNATQVQQFAQGAALGAAAFLSLVAVGAAKGWVQAPAWGWEQQALPTVMRSIAIQSLSHLAVAWNEETVFRGYGFAVTSEALGQPGAIAILVPLFALAHQITPQIFVGQAALGSALMALRLSSGSIWMPLGYHWAWNVVQTAILGPTDGMPSLRPLVVDGPYAWIGRPGHPEPGLLSAIVQGCMALGVSLAWRRGRESATPHRSTNT